MPDETNETIASVFSIGLIGAVISGVLAGVIGLLHTFGVILTLLMIMAMCLVGCAGAVCFDVQRRRRKRKEDRG